MERRIKTSLAILIFGVFYSVSSYAQGLIALDTSILKVDPAISNEKFKAVYKTLQKAIIDYSHNSSIYDSDSKSMSDEAVNGFLSLFDIEKAKVVKDYHKENELTNYNVNEYFFELAESEAAGTGIQSKITETILLEVFKDEKDASQITSRVLVSRIFNNYIQDGKIGYYNPAKTKQLVLTYNTPDYYMDEALITSINFYTPNQDVKEESVKLSPFLVSGSNCNLIDGNTSRPPGVSEDTIVLIDNLICDAFNKYKEAATFLDPSSSTVTATSASRFQQLFTSGSSLHLSDYREYPDNVQVTEYREDVYKFFKNTGLVFNIVDSRIKSIVYDADGFYYVVLTFKKSMNYFLDDKTYDIRKADRKKTYDFDLTYVISQDYMTNPLIESALSTSVEEPENKRTLLTFSPDIGLPLISATPATGFDNITSNTSLGGQAGLGFQVELMSNFTAKYRAEKKPLFWTIGLGIKSFKVTAEMTIPESLSSVFTIDMKDGTQLAEINSLNDKLPFTSLTMPLGVSYRLIESKSGNFEFFLGGKFVPSYILESEGKFDAKGFYNLIYDQDGFSFYDQNYDFQLNPKDSMGVLKDYNIGFLSEVNGDVPGFDSKFILGYRLETSFLLSLSARFMLFGRIGYDGFFEDPMIHSQPVQGDPTLIETLRPQQKIVRNKNLLQEYYTAMKLSQVNIGLGLAYRLNQ